MCGIAGTVNGRVKDSAVDDVRAMLSTQTHRGPEGVSIAAVGPATFGVCHLRFVHHLGPPQPFRTSDRQLMVAFNGEIYNRADLAGELIGDPAITPGCGEAAILAVLYLAEGVQMVHRLNGMFAIAIFDARSGETVLIRDQFGKKPLSYVVTGRELHFSSEVSGLSDGGKSNVDPAAVRRYLTFNVVPAPASLLPGVHKVEPGCVVKIRGAEVLRESYWFPRLHRARHSRLGNPDALDTALGAATRRRLPEVPLGVFLSGGLDSGLVAALAAREYTNPLRSFSLGFPENPSFDESSQAVRMARAVGTRHTVLPLTLAEFAAAARRWLGELDEPIADHSLIPTVVLARAAKHEVKAVLTGDGADELAMGYALFAANALLDSLGHALPPPVVRAALETVGRLRSGDHNLSPAHVAALLVRARAVKPEYSYYAAAAAVPMDMQQTLLTPAAFAAGQPEHLFEAIDGLVRENPDATSGERLQLGLICHFLRDVILAKLDRATMLASIEARSPFLDSEVVELLLGLPQSQKLRGLTGKYIVRRVATRYLPRKLVHQRKRGFRAPIAALLRGPLREWVTDLLAADTLKAGGLFQPKPVGSLLSEHLSGEADHHRPLWSLACLQSWTLAGRARTSSHEFTVMP